MSSRRPRIVILGAGFAGLEAAHGLARAEAEITLIDRHNYHCFQPLLYQVATAQLSPADIAWPVRAILRRQRNLTVLMATVDGVDVRAKRVHAGAEIVPYDILIIATGATHSYFGRDEWAAFAPGLKQIDDATAIRRDLLLAFERAEWTDDPAERARLQTFVIVGGGPTGVEMAGAIAEVARQALPSDFRRIDPRVSRIVLIEAGPRILPALPEELASYAQDALTRMGVEVLTGTRFTGCDAAGVETSGGRIEARTIIWGAGVVASPAAEWIGAERDQAGRVIVNRDLSVPGYSDIFVIGDTASVMDDEGKPVPEIAPAAKQMGQYAAKVVSARLKAKTVPPPFRYAHHGDLATIGRRAAVVRLDSIHLKGLIGWLFWSVAHIYYLIGVRNRFVVAFSWLWSYITHQRGARLITCDDAVRDWEARAARAREVGPPRRTETPVAGETGGALWR